MYQVEIKKNERNFPSNIKNHTFWLTDIKKNMFRYHIDKNKMPQLNDK